MKIRIIKKLNIIFSIIALVFSISVVTYADDTTNSGIVGVGEKQGDEQVVDRDDLSADNFPELYKAWILELGGEKMQVFNSTGAKVYEKVVLPAEFKGKSNITLENKFIRNEQTIILANEYSISLGGYAFSNNIPCLTFIGDGYTIPDYVLFEPWTNMTTSIAEWCSNPENAKNLVADINDNVLNEAVGNDILTFLSGGGSIVFEPVSFYPESTEQIYVNTLQIAKDHGMQFNEAFINSFTQIKAQLEAELKNAVKHYSKSELQTIFDKENKAQMQKLYGYTDFNSWLEDHYTYDAAGNFYYTAQSAGLTTLADMLLRDIYYNVGILKGHVMGSESDGISREGYRDYLVDTIQKPEFVLLSWTETTTYVHEWETDGFWFNFRKQEQTGTGFEYTIERGMEDSRITTDHNKLYSVIVKSTDPKVLSVETLLVGTGLLKDNDNMRFGAALVCGGEASRALILIKFHSNLEQLGGTGSVISIL